MTQNGSERWRPPVYSPVKTPRQKLFHAIRCFVDVQAGSVWSDLVAELPHFRGRVLDVGCGSQPYRGLLSREAQYIGIDIADAEEHFGYKMPDTIYYQGDIWPLEDASVDYILCTETLEHVADPVPFLAEAARVLRPGGMMLLTVPFSARWHFIPYDFWRFTPSSLKHLLTQAGLEDVSVYARGNAVTVACYKVMALIVPLLFPQDGTLVTKAVRMLIGLLLLPFFLILAVVSNISLKGRGGDDCLGYTVLALRSDNGRAVVSQSGVAEDNQTRTLVAG